MDGSKNPTPEPSSITYHLEDVPIWAAPQVSFFIYGITKEAPSPSSAPSMEAVLPHSLLRQFYSENKLIKPYVLPTARLYNDFYIFKILFRSRKNADIMRIIFYF